MTLSFSVFFLFRKFQNRNYFQIIYRCTFSFLFDTNHIINTAISSTSFVSFLFFFACIYTTHFFIIEINLSSCLLTFFLSKRIRHTQQKPTSNILPGQRESIERISRIRKVYVFKVSIHVLYSERAV